MRVTLSLLYGCQTQNRLIEGHSRAAPLNQPELPENLEVEKIPKRKVMQDNVLYHLSRSRLGRDAAGSLQPGSSTLERLGRLQLFLLIGSAGLAGTGLRRSQGFLGFI
jgi:hypothetical protein